MSRPPARSAAASSTSGPTRFQATITVTSARALTVGASAGPSTTGQTVGQMRGATFTQDGSRVTASSNKSVPASGSVAFGFPASWHGRNTPPYDFTRNGHARAGA